LLLQHTKSCVSTVQVWGGEISPEGPGLGPGPSGPPLPVLLSSSMGSSWLLPVSPSS